MEKQKSKKEIKRIDSLSWKYLAFSMGWFIVAFLSEHYEWRVFEILGFLMAGFWFGRIFDLIE